MSAAEVLRTAPFAHYHARRAARVLGVPVAVVNAMAVDGRVRAVRVQDGNGGWVWAVDAHRIVELAEGNARTGLHPEWACGRGCGGCVADGEGGVMRRPARILDVDGTLCNVTSVRHYVMRPRELKDFDAFHAASAGCPPNQVALDYAVETYARGWVPVVVTARMERWYDVTRGWLDRHMPVPFDGPFHRRDGDTRSDRVVKLEILRYLRRHYDIRGAIDDNPEVIELWRSQGIPVTVVPGWV